ncbi:uncharacterized protein LOC109853652 [Pseudomyrmex gracilis]|uniref:uncharacterized protein LOC109853652 n=1 Tax=Pseudomyrmex gracilis TaxID=219809 RepID=UPI000994D371|nr:uncharacterized protein LOC109853652 [Pseudomyrmex gracilis]
MKTILLVMCVVVLTHAILMRHPFYDNAEACLKDLSSKKKFLHFSVVEALQPTFSINLEISKIIPKNISNATLVDVFICALKKDGLITPEGLSKSGEEQYCSQVLTKPQNIMECQKIIKHCTDLECTQNATMCTYPEEVIKDMTCNVMNGIALTLESPLHIIGGSIM